MTGYRGDGGTSLIASYLRDNRENPDQQHFHFTPRTAQPDNQRRTVDVLCKRGLVEGARIAKAGTTITYDGPRYFARLSFDPNTNFTADTHGASASGCGSNIMTPTISSESWAILRSIQPAEIVPRETDFLDGIVRFREGAEENPLP